MNEIIKTMVKKHCLTRTNKVNNYVVKNSWWEKRGLTRLKNDIVESTSFLPIKSSISQRIYHILNDIDSIPFCKNEKCNRKTNFVNTQYGYHHYCSKACSTQCKKRNEKIVKNSNYKEIVKKTKETNLNKYGVENFVQSDIFRKKYENICKERYGSTNPMHSDLIKNRVRESNLNKYGSECWFASDEGKKKLRKLRETKGGSLKLDSNTLDLLNNFEYLKDLNTKEEYNVTEIAEMIGVTPKSLIDRYGRIWITHYRNRLKQQKKLYDDIVSIFNEEVCFNDRTVLDPKELDIYIPSKRFAIEYNGLYWHSFNRKEENAEKNRHYDKYKQCLDRGIDLLQITDVELQTKRDIVMNIIRNRLGIHNQTIRASNCEVRIVDKKVERNFLEQNHIQGFVPSKVSLGLYYNDTLVYLMSFGKPRFNTKYDYELIRMCSKNGYKIHGGSSKLFKYFSNHYNFNSIVSYCDLSKFNGNTYYNLNFYLNRKTNPNYYYHKCTKDTIISRYAAQKHKLNKVLEQFDSNLTESDNMFMNGYYRYWDCGNSVYVYER